MEEAALARYKKALEVLAAELKAALASGSDMTAVVSLDDPIGRVSRIDALQSQEISLGMKAGMRQRYEMALRALESVARGSYGTCVNCKRPISEARLDAIPETPLCVECSA